jgi:hypothetical protein
MDIATLIRDFHIARDRHAAVRARRWMPLVFDETFAQPGFLYYDHIQGTNCSEWRCLECGLWTVIPDGQALHPCSHVASDADYDG